jgi:hypothetical protein
MVEDISSFKNPEGYWSHEGAFSIELTADAPKDPPKPARLLGSIVYVDKDGRIKQSVGGIQFYAGKIPFYWAYSCMKAIRDDKGDLLWVNKNYSTM